MQMAMVQKIKIPLNGRKPIETNVGMSLVNGVRVYDVETGSSIESRGFLGRLDRWLYTAPRVRTAAYPGSMHKRRIKHKTRTRTAGWIVEWKKLRYFRGLVRGPLQMYVDPETTNGRTPRTFLSKPLLPLTDKWRRKSINEPARRRSSGLSDHKQ